jgi:hypothetical protein
MQLLMNKNAFKVENRLTIIVKKIYPKYLGSNIDTQNLIGYNCFCSERTGSYRSNT